MEPEKEENSEVVRIYNQFMKGVTTERVLKELSSDNMRLHRIVRVPERRVAPIAVYLINISNNGMMAEYRVRIWEFCVYVRVLNLPFKP
jgi:hypothetical protein